MKVHPSAITLLGMLVFSAAPALARPNIAKLANASSDGRSRQPRANACGELDKIATGDSDASVRLAAVNAIGEHIARKPYRANQALLALLVKIAVHDKDAAVRSAAVNAIAKRAKAQQCCAGYSGALITTAVQLPDFAEKVFPGVIRGDGPGTIGNGRHSDVEKGTASLRIVTLRSSRDASFMITISGIEIVEDSTSMQPPLRCQLASDEQHIVRVEASSDYSIDATKFDIGNRLPGHFVPSCARVTRSAGNAQTIRYTTQ